MGKGQEALVIAGSILPDVIAACILFCFYLAGSSRSLLALYTLLARLIKLCL
jgi:hypothetical protein